MTDKILHGFELIREARVPEIDAKIVTMSHIKSGAELIFIDRPDDNKTFAIGFKTIPTDDTGVFHILEHTVLAGSEHFPVKDPMTALLSGSLYTYLNAFTYPDKTVYPVSSKNNKAFLDLVNVYMDAVLHPLVLTNKSIFMSEGHHLDINEDGTLNISGIVYNEMKGAYSSPDELMEHYISRNMYKGGTYSYDSGGFPEAIPTLTYEKFLKAHREFYHPENSVIVLDGNIELDKTLTLIDSYLADYEKTGKRHEITLGTCVTERAVEYYPVSEEGEENTTRLSIAYPAFNHSNYIEHIALTAILDVISDSNASPLKSAILSSGLCENLYAYYNSGALTTSLNVSFLNVKDGREDELVSLFNKTVCEILEKGIDRDKLEGSLNLIEFKTREADFGSFPRGMVYMLAAIEYALYGERAENAFNYDKSFADLRTRLDTDYYNDLLRKVVSRKPVTVVLKPDKELAKTCDDALRQHLDKLGKEMTESERQNLICELEEYKRYQDTPDTEEALATIPTLEISDIGNTEPTAPTELYTLDGANIISHGMESAGIVYTDMYFDVSDADKDTMLAMRILASVMPELDTKNYPADDFRSRVKHSLGELSLALTTEKHKDTVKLYFVVRCSSLITNLDKMCELVKEYLYAAVYDAKEKIKQRINQLFTSSYEGITADGLSIALTRSAAPLSDLAALRDLIFGYGYHVYLKELKDDLDAAIKLLIPSFENIREKYFKRERLTLAVTCPEAKNAAKKLVSIVKPGGTPAGKIQIQVPECRNEYIDIPSTVGYSALSASFKSAGLKEYCGALSVLGSILTYELLWNKIRVQGGAYDTGFLVKGNSGIITAYSYRDPSPEKSVEYFGTLINEARKIINEVDISRYIISTIGTTDTVSTPRSASLAATVMYLNGQGTDYKERIRGEILATDKSKLAELLDVIEMALSTPAVCITAPKKLVFGDYAKLEI